MFDFIHLVRHNPGITQIQVREQLQIDKGAAARRATSLEAKGYLIRKPNPKDGRSQLLYATELAEKCAGRGMERMEQRYDRYIGDSYRAMEKTNFYDAVYSPVILILNAVVVAIVMLLSASGNPKVFTLFDKNISMEAVKKTAVLTGLDEITANLDAETEQAVLKALKQVSEDRTVISISHRSMAELGRIIRIHG